MTVPEVEAAIHARPFRPLWVVMADGEKLPVINQEIVFLAKADESLIIVKEQGGLHILDVGLIARVEPQV
jgi:hypothetical protein